MKIKYCILLLILFISCSKSEKEIIINEQITTSEGISIETEKIHDKQNSIITWDNYDWLTEYDWVLNMRIGVAQASIYLPELEEWTPIVRFYKFDIPQNSIMYQERLRNERFLFLYQTEKKDELYFLEQSNTEALEILFKNDYTRLTLISNGSTYSGQNRVNQQIDPNYPLIGIWGDLPHLTEYRLVDPTGCLYYMEISKRFPNWVFRKGTYLLKQTGELEFETISAFPDGKLKLEFLNESLILLSLAASFSSDSKEETEIFPLSVRRLPYKIE